MKIELTKSCTRCGTQKADSDFYAKKAECKECFKKRVREYEKTHPVVQKKRYQAWRISRRFYDVLKSSRQQAKLKGHIACSATEDELSESYTETCTLCGRRERDLKQRLQADHNHLTGQFRGWLCRSCNTAIGLLGESPVILAKAITYLTKPQRG